MPLPQNWQQIYSFLIGHGYSDAAAAGILGNIEQESGGNPESVGSGGGGLIGFTPLPAGYVTGNVQKDLQTQLNAILAYDNRQGGVSTLNSEPSARAAAIYYMQHFERPNPAAANEPNRVQSAIEVFNAAKGKNITPSTTATASTSSLTGNIGGDIVSGALSAFGITNFKDFLERLLLVLVGLAFIIIGIIKLTHADTKIEGLGSQALSYVPGPEGQAAGQVLGADAKRRRAKDVSHDVKRDEVRHSTRKKARPIEGPTFAGPQTTAADRKMVNRSALPGDTGKGLMETPEITGADSEPIPF